MKKLLIIICIALSFSGFGQENRLALVIGNSEYKYGGTLKNPTSDAYLMGFTLEDLGFEVISVINGSRDEMEEAIDNFRTQIEGNSVALLYYTGHGMQVDGVNYLLPVDARLKKAGDAKKEAIDVTGILKQFEELSTSTNIIILDACRETPFPSWVEEGSGGFVEMPAPDGTILGFATSPGATAPAGTGANGIYAENLTRQMMIPQTIEEVLNNTGSLVTHISKGKQNPREWSQLTTPFSLIKGYVPAPSGNGSIMVASAITGVLSIDGIEISTVEPNTIIPIDNIKPGSYELKITGESTWEEAVLVIGNQVTNVNAVAATVRGKLPVDSYVAAGREVHIDRRDQHQYPWMKFGSQTWMTKNLSFESSDGSFCYDNNASNCDIYGRLYTWESAQNVCPDGWHLPSDEEWMVLEKFIGMRKGATNNIGLRGKIAGNILKDPNQGVWSPPKENNFSANGFNALPAGYNLSEAKSLEIEESAIFWTSTKHSVSEAYYRKIEDSKGGIHRYFGKKSRGCSVRCIKD